MVLEKKLSLEAKEKEEEEKKKKKEKAEAEKEKEEQKQREQEEEEEARREKKEAALSAARAVTKAKMEEEDARERREGEAAAGEARAAKERAAEAVIKGRLEEAAASLLSERAGKLREAAERRAPRPRREENCGEEKRPKGSGSGSGPLPPSSAAPPAAAAVGRSAPAPGSVSPPSKVQRQQQQQQPAASQPASWHRQSRTASAPSSVAPPAGAGGRSAPPLLPEGLPPRSAPALPKLDLASSAGNWRGGGSNGRTVQLSLTRSVETLEPFGGRIPMKKVRELKATTRNTLIKVLSDTDDRVTLAIKRADKREKRERKQVLEYRSKARLQERDFVRGNWFAETAVSLPPPTVRRGFRDVLSDESIAVSAALAIDHIEKHRREEITVDEKEAGEGGREGGREGGKRRKAMARVPELNGIESVRRKQNIKKRIDRKLREITNVKP